MNDWLSNSVTITGKKRLNGTMKTYLGSVQHFLRFLCVTEQSGFDDKKIKKFEPILKAWKRDLWKGIEERKHNKNLEDSHDKITNFDKSELIALSISTLKEYVCQVNNLSITRAGFCNVRDYLLTHLVLINASRPGVIANMTLEEFEAADKQEDGYVVSVKKHKTSYKGPAHIAFDTNLFKDTANYINYVRAHLPGVSTSKTSPVFIIWSGSKMDSTLVTGQFNTYWSKAIGETSKQRNINPNLVRKYSTTLMHENHNEMAKDAAIHLCHSLIVARENYDIIDKQKKAASFCKNLQLVQRESNNDLSKDQISDLFAIEIKTGLINKSQVAEKLILLNISSSEKYVKKILDSVGYIIKSNLGPKIRNSSLLKSSEISKEKLGNHSISSSSQQASCLPSSVISEDCSDIQLEYKDRFKRFRKKFTSKELSLINKYFSKQYILSQKPIYKEEVKSYIENIPELDDLLKKFGISSLIFKIRTEREKLTD